MMYELKNVTKVFHSRRKKIAALDRISLSLPDKGRIFVIGKSGSGKSTFLNLLAGYSSPTEGEVLFRGKDISKRSNKELDLYHYEDIAFVFQNYCILEDLTVGENVALGRKENYKRISKDVDEVLGKVLLDKKGDKKASLLSGGEKQRVAIARALIKSPYAILCDEPTGNLDNNSSKEVLDILKEYSKKSLVVIVSHNLFDAYEYADRILTIDKGKIIEDKSLKKELSTENEYYLSRNTFLDKKEVDKINSFIGRKDSPTIKSRKDAFEDTKCSLSDVPLDSREKRKWKSHFAHSLQPVRKTINSKKLKTILFSLLIPLLLTLFTSRTSLQGFEVPKRQKNEDYFLASDTYVRGKTLSLSFVSSGNERVRPVYRDKITAEDDACLSSLKEEEKPYKLYRVGNFFSRKGNDPICNGRFHAYFDTLDRRHIQNSGGLLLADKTYIEKNLRVSSLEFAAKADVQKKTGVYITDYLADNYLYARPERYTSYDSLLGERGSSYRSYVYRPNSIYINGIVKTGYKEKIKDFLSEAENSGQSQKYVLEDKYQDSLDYIFNSLILLYSTNRDFFSDLEEERTIAHFLSAGRVSLSSVPLYSNRTSFGYNEKLKDGERAMSISVLNDLTSQDVNAFLAAYNNQQGGKRTVSTYIRTTRGRNVYGNLKAEKIYRLDDLLIDDKKDNKETIQLSKSDYLRLLKAYAIPFAYYFKGEESGKRAEALLDGRNFFSKTIQSELSYNTAYYLKPFESLFGFLAEISLIGTVLTIGFYSVFLVLENRYRIGVMKSQGYSASSVSGYFLLQVLLVVLISSVLYPLFTLAFSYILNVVLSKALLRRNQRSRCYRVRKIVTLGWKGYLIGIAISLIISLIRILPFFLLFRRKKIADILQRKE